MFPIYQSLYKHLPPLFNIQHPGNAVGPGKIDLPTSQSSLVDGNHFFVAAAAAAAMEQAAVAAAAANSKLDQRSEESISPSPPVVTPNGIQHPPELDLNHLSKVSSTSPKQPFLKFSVSAILSKAKAEITETDQDLEAVKPSEHNEGKICFSYYLQFKEQKLLAH